MITFENRLRWAGFLTLFTFAGHTLSIFAPQTKPPSVIAAYEVMMQTLVPMPIGSPKTLFGIMSGANLALSIYLLVAGVFFYLLSKSEFKKIDAQMIVLNSLGIGAIALISGFYFFPLPAICTGIAAILGLSTTVRGNKKASGRDAGGR
jgi:hypothetical protein